MDTASLDHLMDRASHALTRMDYLTCEDLCMQALARAREAADWPYYARILMPLQEARRQRRLIAADGAIRLGTSRRQSADKWLSSLQAGCLLLTYPHTAADARQLDAEARHERRHIELLLADNPIDDDHYRITSFRGPSVSCVVAAPPVDWRDIWLAPGERPEPGAEDDGDVTAGGDTEPGRTPADWFLDAAEALGDAAIQHVTADEGDVERIEQLEAMLAVATDHEILHQRLGDAARAMAR
ncbi:MAG: hypothetical protein WD009_10770 [Phycisphaeraceae bacterium]